MRLTLITVLSCLLFFLHAGGYDYNSQRFSTPTDTLPPPPPGMANPISGPISACVGDQSEYSVDVPISCICQWSVNGIIQSDTISPLIITWTQPGQQVVSVIFICTGGQISDPQTLDVYIYGAPPSPVQGPEESCEGDTEIYTTTVGPGEYCEWRVDGVLQPTVSGTLEVTWYGIGDHLIEVRAVSDCGTGNPTFKNVRVLFQPYVFLGNDTTILLGNTLLLDAGNPGSDFLWSTGETTQTITVGISGIYAVNVSNICGADTDTIEVSVVVGIAEREFTGDGFGVMVQKGKISFTGLPIESERIQVINLSGIICHDVPPVSEITLTHAGIYIIRLICQESICYKKVFIP